MTPPASALSFTRTHRLSAGQLAAVRWLIESAEAVDGVPPVSEQGRLRLDGGSVEHLLVSDAAAVIGYAQLEPTGVELLIAPAARGQGAGHRLAEEVLAASSGGVLVWAHGDLPAARALATRLEFRAIRELRQLRRPDGPLPDVGLPPGVRLRAFAPGQDDAAWLALNARAFAGHPEQGAWTPADLASRLALPGFDPAGFLLAERADGTLAGFHWTKVHEPGRLGEVYVIGVDPAAQGTGLGKALLVAGLRHLAAAGIPEVLLYVESDNSAALTMYERLGFATAVTDVLYARG